MWTILQLYGNLSILTKGIINEKISLYCVRSYAERWTQLAFTWSKLTKEILEQGVKYVFIVNFEHISHLILVFLLLTLKM